MTKKGIIEEFYNLNEQDAIKFLYANDNTSHKLIGKAVGNKLVTAYDTIITSDLLDCLYLICLTATFADSDDECFRIANTICQFYNKTNNILPSLIEDRGLLFASKTIIALSFYPQSLEKKWKNQGAPSPSFYRNVSKNIYKNNNQKDISAHHEQWELFLGEVLV